MRRPPADRGADARNYEEKACAEQFGPVLEAEIERLVGPGAAGKLDFEAVETAAQERAGGARGQATRRVRQDAPGQAGHGMDGRDDRQGGPSRAGRRLGDLHGGDRERGPPRHPRSGRFSFALTHGLTLLPPLGDDGSDTTAHSCSVVASAATSTVHHSVATSPQPKVTGRPRRPMQ